MKSILQMHYIISSTFLRQMAVVDVSLMLPFRCEAVLGEFLRGIKREPKNVNFPHMVNILVIHSQSEGMCNLMRILLNISLIQGF